MKPEIKLKPGAVDWVMQQNGIVTRRAMAYELGISPPLLSQIESEHRGVSAAFLVGMYTAFGIGLDHKIYHIIREKP